MKTNKLIAFFAAGLFLLTSCEHSLAPLEDASGWEDGNAPSYYEKGIAKAEGRNGNDVLCIRGASDADIDATDFGAMMKNTRADQFRGKRIRCKAHIKTSEANEGAGLWVRVENEQYLLAFDNTDNRLVKGTADWQEREIVLDIPEEATTIVYGIYLTGKGKMWVDGVELKEVKKQVAVTGKSVHEPLPQQKEKICLRGYGYVLPHNKVAYIKHVSNQIQQK